MTQNNLLCWMDWDHLKKRLFDAQQGQLEPDQTAYSVMFGVSARSGLPFLFAANSLYQTETADPNIIQNAMKKNPALELQALFIDNHVGNALSIPVSCGSILNTGITDFSDAVTVFKSGFNNVIDQNIDKLYRDHPKANVYFFDRQL